MNHLSPLPFSAADLAGSIPVRFYQVCQQLPAAHPAYTGPDGTLTYQAVAAASQGVAAALVAYLGQARVRADQKAVALLLPHSAASLVGIIGVLQTGHFFVPLDLIMGEATLQKILLDCPPQVIVTTAALQPHLAELLPPDQRPPVLCIENITPTALDARPDLPTDPQLYASIQYTSGSTGMPRGVIRTHATHLNTSHLNHAICDFLPSDRISHLFSYSLAMSNSDLFGGLLNGATLVPQQIAKLTPVTLYQWLAANQITQLRASIGMLRGLAALADTHPPLPHLRMITSGGEVMRRPEVEQVCRLLPTGGKLVLRLASTEAGTYATCVIEAGKPWHDEHSAIGTLPLNHQVMIVDEQRQPVGAGEAGEIAVRSRFLAAGYWQRPAETAAKFLPDPDDRHGQIFFTGDTGRMTADGRLEFLGRTDFLVKIRGYRVQLEEVETALLALAVVQAAVVVALDDDTGNKQLVAYVVTGEPVPTIDALRQLLLRTLPTYMIPTHFVVLDALPLLPNGKVNRKALPAPDTRRPLLGTAYAPARNPLEAQLVKLWEDLLGVHPIGVHDDFFALGGHSLTLLRLANELQNQLGQEVPLATFLHGSTIAQLVAVLQASGADDKRTDAASAPCSEPYPLNTEDSRLVEWYRSGQTARPLTLTRKQWLLNHLFPYAARIHLFRLLVSNRFIQRRFFADKCETIRRFAVAVGVPPERTAPVVTTYLMRVLCSRYCRGILAHTLTRKPTNHVVISGQGYMDAAQQRGQGMILVDFHSQFVPGILPILLKQGGYGEQMTYMGRSVLQQNPALLQAFQRYFGTDEEALVIAKFLSLQMDMAQRKLKQGGIVWIAPDGGSGKRALTFSVLGMQRGFSTGFAELALQTGAMVIPVRRAVAATGELQITFLAPLTAGSATATHEERVQHLMQQYVSFLAETWQLDPANVGFSQMRHFLQSRQKEGMG